NDDDRSKAQCKSCTATVSRGGKESTLFNTSNLIKHLKAHHSAKYTEVTDASGARAKRPILTDVLQKKKMRTHTHREREVERKTVPHRLSDCLCTSAGDSADPFVTEMCSCANPVLVLFTFC